MNIIKLYTTGDISGITIFDLGALDLIHPVSGLTLNDMFTSDEIYKSNDLKNAIDNNYIYLLDDNNQIINSNLIETYSKGVSISEIETYLTGYTTNVEYLLHTDDVNIHFLKNDILLSQLSDVNTGGTNDGYVLSFSGGTWKTIPPGGVDLSNYYNKQEVYNTGQTYSKIEIDNNFLKLSGGTIIGDINIIGNITGVTLNYTNATITNLNTTSSNISNLTGTSFYSNNSYMNNLTGVVFNSTNSVITNLTATTSAYFLNGLNVTSNGVNITGNTIGTGSATFNTLRINNNTSGIPIVQIGNTNPFYMSMNWPTLSYNAYWNTTWRYGAGSSNQYGAFHSIDPSSGQFNIYISPTPGNADASFTPSLVFAAYPTGIIHIPNRMYIGGTTTPTSRLHLNSGTSTAGTSPIKLTPGINLTTPEIGAIEYSGLKLTYTDNSSTPIRQHIIPAAYGFINEQNKAGTTVNVATANVWYGWVSANSNRHLLTQFTNNGTADRITISGGGYGVYELKYNLSCSVGTTNNTYRMGIFKNDTLLDDSVQYFRVNNTGMWLNISKCIVLDNVNVNDYFDIRFTSASNNRNVIIYSLSFVINRINS